MSSEASATSLTIPPPDDLHLHLRDGDWLKTLVPWAAKQFRRAIIMPNLVPPITTTEQALAYKTRILECVPETYEFEPLMTLYLTDNTPPEEILRAKESQQVFAVKLYPAGATTNSDAGVTDITHVIATLETMSSIGMPLLIHGEVTDNTVDVFDREAEFLRTVFPVIRERVPGLKIVLEHITTEEAVNLVLNEQDNVAATITCHHLLYNRTAIFQGGLRPHMYCLPILKTERDRAALISAIASGSRKFFLGTDSAPHPIGSKHTSCCRAGIFTSYSALELYLEAFEEANALDKFENFACRNGADFYGIPRNEDQETRNARRWVLNKEPRIIEDNLPLGTQGDLVIPLRAGESVAWTLQD